MNCPLCGNAWTTLSCQAMNFHLYNRHGIHAKALEAWLCFCGQQCPTELVLEMHWFKRGGLAAHLTEYLLNLEVS